MADIELIRRLLKIAHDANPPELDPNPDLDNYSTLNIHTSTGWEVEFVYRNGSLSYVKQFTSPDGEVFDVYRNPPDPRLDDCEPDQIFSTLKCWRDPSDTQRLLSTINDNPATS